MQAYKAVYKDMHSQFGDQPVYEMGKTYIFPIAERGHGGYHAAEDPLFCLNFIDPSQGRYFLVELQGRLDAAGCNAGADSAAAAERLTLLRELSVEEMLWRSMQYRLNWAKLPVQGDVRGERCMTVTRDDGQKVCATGTRCVAVAHTPDSTAVAAGDNALAIAEAPGSTAEACGYRSLAVAFGAGTSAKTKNGAWLLTINPDAPEGQQLTWEH